MPLGISTLLLSSHLKCTMTLTGPSPLFPHRGWTITHSAPQVILVGPCVMVHCFYPCIPLMTNLTNLSSLNSSTTVSSHYYSQFPKCSPPSPLTILACAWTRFLRPVPHTAQSDILLRKLDHCTALCKESKLPARKSLSLLK